MPPSTLYIQKPPSGDLASTRARFVLYPNEPGPQRAQHWIGYLGAAVLLFTAHLVFTRVLQLEGLSYLMALAPLILIILNVAYFLRRFYARQEQLVLQVDEVEIQLFRGAQLLHSAFLSDLDVVREGPGVVHIHEALFPDLSIGKQKSGAAYRLGSEEKWGELVEWLK